MSVAPNNGANAETSGSTNTIPNCDIALVGTTSNGYAVVLLVFATQVATGITVTIGGSSATELTGSPLNASTIQVRLYGLALGAVSGTLACSATWTNNTTVGMSAFACDNVDQATSYVSPLSSEADIGAGSATPDLVVTGGASGDYTLAVLGLDSGRDPSANLQTSVYHSNVQFQAGMGVSRAARAGSDITHGWTDSSSTSYAYLGINLKASSGGPTPAQLIPAFTQTGGGYGISYV